ncbi:hypothetical protein [Sinomonas sp. P47F7]|uniref:hypothetical protein n=1 Tax=Sinomonas sp. P47F7 TaxID=3410987 RepID=UPI003BF5A704
MFGSAARRAAAALISTLLVIGAGAAVAAPAQAAPTRAAAPSAVQPTRAAAPSAVQPTRAAAPSAVQPALSYPQRNAQIGITLVTLQTRDKPTATYDTNALQSAFNTANGYWQTISAGHISLHLDSLSNLSTQVSSTDEFVTIMNAVTNQLHWTDTANKVIMVVDPASNITINGTANALGVTWSTGSEGGRVMLAQPSQFTAPVMTHELGHIQGLGHANTLECTDSRPDSRIVNGAFADSNCTSREYGNNTDVMGISQYNEPYLDSVLFQFGGFGNGNEIADVGTVAQSATYTLTPWAGTGANRAIKFQDPVTGEEYYLQYKAPVGYDAPTAVNGNQGVQVIKTSTDPTESVLIPKTTAPFSGYYRSDLSWQAGQTFTTDGGTTVTVNSVTASSATVTVAPALEHRQDIGMPAGATPISGRWWGDGKAYGGWVLNGKWCLQRPTSGPACFWYGIGTDKPVVGDWNGDGIDTPGIVRNGQWQLTNSISTLTVDRVVNYGTATDTPITGDWDGQGVTTIGVVRNGLWYLTDSLSPYPGVTYAFPYGDPGDIPIAGNWAGGRSWGIGVVRNGWFYLSNNGQRVDNYFPFGVGTDTPVTGDWDGVGGSTVGIVRGSTWQLTNSNFARQVNIIFN